MPPLFLLAFTPLTFLDCSWGPTRAAPHAWRTLFVRDKQRGAPSARPLLLFSRNYASADKSPHALRGPGTQTLWNPGTSGNFSHSSKCSLSRFGPLLPDKTFLEPLKACTTSGMPQFSGNRSVWSYSNVLLRARNKNGEELNRYWSRFDFCWQTVRIEDFCGAQRLSAQTLPIPGKNNKSGKRPEKMMRQIIRENSHCYMLINGSLFGLGLSS